MYKIIFSASFKKDIRDIIYYILYNLKNQSAAFNLTKKFQEGVNSILIFPYGSPVSIKLKKEYRKVRVKNYLIFYTINEEEQSITLVRVLYKKMSAISRLE